MNALARNLDGYYVAPGRGDGAALADPNWLLSAAAQSTAALVAIVGGLIVSRLITLYSERAALRRRRDILAHQSGQLQNSEMFLRFELVADDVRSSLREWVELLWETDGLCSDDELLFLGNPSGWETTDYVPWLRAIREAYRESRIAVRALDDRHPRSLPTDLEEMDTPEGLSGESRDVWLHVLNLYLDERFEKHQAENPADFLPLQVRQWPPHRELTVEGLEQAYREYNTTMSEIRRNRHEQELTSQALADVEEPPGIWPGLWILGVFAVSGIVFPVVLMATMPRTLDVGWRVAVVVAFCLGLSALLAYIWWFARRLKEEDAGEVDG